MTRALALSLTALLAAAPAALAQGGGAAAPPAGGAPMGSGETGGVRPGDRSARREVVRRKRVRRLRSRPVLAAFELERTRLFLYGHPALVSFRVDGRASSVTARLYVLPAGGGQAVRAIDLGERAVGETHTTELRAEGLPPGAYRLRLAARDRRGRALRLPATVASIKDFQLYGHTFPLQGAYTFGGTGSRFGAPRRGHRHQGQDLAAVEGTTVVAPHGGTISVVQYQRDGAGHYVVLDGRDGRDYVFMHLRAGSIPVSVGQRVRTGQKVGEVGNTGRSFGAHLHFEIWEGGDWFSGGHPVDPLPYLRRWARYS